MTFRIMTPRTTGDGTHHILLVDDEPNVLSALTRELRAIAGADIHACASPLQVLSQRMEHDYAVVIADYRMPDMDGIAFLERFAALQPHASRILMSAHADEEMLCNAINRARANAFLPKPWERGEALERVSQAILEYREWRAVVNRLASADDSQSTLKWQRALLRQIYGKGQTS